MRISAHTRLVRSEITPTAARQFDRLYGPLCARFTAQIAVVVKRVDQFLKKAVPFNHEGLR